MVVDETTVEPIREALGLLKQALEGIEEGWDPEEFLDGILRGGGQGLGVTHAATFEVFPLGWD